MKPLPIEHKHVVVYFQVHQPRRLRYFSFFDIGSGTSYFDDVANKELMKQIALTCYRPANHLLLSLIQKYPNIRIAYSISGVALEQMQKYTPVVLDDFRLLAETGAVEFLSETYYHSLASLLSEEEFTSQVSMHREKIQETLGVNTTVFRNTELIYWDRVGEMIKEFEFSGVLAEGHSRLLGNMSSHSLYHHPDQHRLKLFFRDYHLSDDIAFRFSQQDSKQSLLTANKFINSIESVADGQNLVTLGLDYETFGEHKKLGSGIFKFLGELMKGLALNQKIKMVTPSEAIARLESVGPIHIAEPRSWADKNRDLSPWLGNEMQKDAFENLKRLETQVKKSGSAIHLDTWRNLQTSDHFYYMSTVKGDDGAVHRYFSPYPSPHEAFMNYLNVLFDFSNSLGSLTTKPIKSRARQSIEFAY